MSENSDRLRDVLLDSTEKVIEVERVVQLLRIADALEAIEETGVYVYQQGTDEPDTLEPSEGRRRP